MASAEKCKEGGEWRGGPYGSRGAELACGEVFQGAKASVEFGEAGPALRGLG